MKTLFIILLLSFSNCIFAQQDSLTLSKNYKFKDGIFVDFNAFQQNQPNYNWEDLRTSAYTNPQTFLTQVHFFEVKEGAKVIDPESIWGLCIAGIPYIRLPKGSVPKKDVTVFAGLKVRGKICYFTYEIPATKKIAISAYNPNTGRPFRTAYVDREYIVTQKKILHFETGEVKIFNTQNLLSWIKDDEKLWKTVSELSEEEARQKLFKCLLIYDDRNQVQVKSNI